MIERHAIARASLSAVWRSVERIANALLEREELDREGVEDALAGDDIHAPVFAVQRAHGLLPAISAPVASASKVVDAKRTAKTAKKLARQMGDDPRVASPVTGASRGTRRAR